MKKLIATTIGALPFMASAQVITDVNTLTYKLTNLGNTFIQILMAFSVLLIIFNVVRFLIVGADNEEKRGAAKNAIIWGVVGLFVILSIWGLVRILTNSFRTDTTAPTNQYPQLQYPQPVP